MLKLVTVDGQPVDRPEVGEEVIVLHSVFPSPLPENYDVLLASAKAAFTADPSEANAIVFFSVAGGTCPSWDFLTIATYLANQRGLSDPYDISFEELERITAALCEHHGFSFISDQLIARVVPDPYALLQGTMGRARGYGKKPRRKGR